MLERCFSSLQIDKPGGYGQSHDSFGLVHTFIPVQGGEKPLTKIANLNPVPAFSPYANNHPIMIWIFFSA
jgi:hypothetical protein